VKEILVTILNYEGKIFCHIHRCFLFLNPRSGILGNDLLNIALGIDLDGKKEILRFWTNPTESSNI
jgi:hypothetical protein